MVRIAALQPHSIAEELELQIGSRIVRINGQPVRDAIDYRFLEADGLLEVELDGPCGGERIVRTVQAMSTGVTESPRTRTLATGRWA